MSTYKGFYRVKNPAKYEGDFKNVVYRSHWEMQVFRWCDTNDQVLKWSSEEIVVPYWLPLDKKYHRYFVDVKYTTKEGTFLVEIKPKKQTIPPKEPQRKTKGYIYEAMEYAKNQSKWEVAKEWCEDRGYEFKILTEEDLNIRF